MTQYLLVDKDTVLCDLDYLGYTDEELKSMDDEQLEETYNFEVNPSLDMVFKIKQKNT